GAPRGDRPSGDGEHRPFTPRGDAPRGDRGPRPSFGDRGAPRGDRPSGDGERRPFPPRGDAPRGDRGPRPSFGDRGAPRGDRPSGDGERRPFTPRGDAPRGDRGPRPSFGDRGAPRGDRPSGNGERRPFSPRDDAPRGASSDRTPRPSFNDRGAPGGPSADRGPRPSFGDRAAPRGDRPTGAGERRPFKPREDSRGPASDRAPRPSFSDTGAPRRERNHAHDGSPRPASFDRQRPPGDRPYAKREASPERFGDERKPPRKPAAKPSKPRDADAPPSPARIAREGEDGLVRLSKVMSELGLCSRREADEWIEKGWVLVDGVVIDTLGTKIRPDQNIEIAQAAHAAQMQQVTILIHKPVGYVSGQAEDGYQPAVTLVNPSNHWADDQSGIRFSPTHLRTLAPAGRLDIDSTGLLVLTQDGRVAKQLIGGHSDVDKEYLVRVKFGEHELDIESHFPPESLALLRHGLALDDVPLKTAQVSWQNGEQLRFVLREGKKRQIRRMCELVGLEVVGLKRIRMGHVTLGALPPGQWRYLGADESF
ncbi:pseudouridine synthase, partial [Caballeronia sordidicola]|uniref:pseudouridine synthase n=2 Tax=Caballeronia sordidicola TaxID=196367 RepID=UPI00117C12A7